MSPLIFLREQFFGKPVGPAPSQSLEGRIAIVTGGNTGLGLQTAIHLAKLNPKKIIITSRDAKKGEAALKTIQEATGYTSAETWSLDLSSFKSVQAFAEKCKSLDRLDCVVENAGVTGLDWTLTEDGWEQILQVNSIATGLLGVLLLPLLERTANLPKPAGSATYQPHLTIVASEVHMFATFAESKTEGSILEVLNTQPARFDKMERYNISKLLNIYTAQGISQLPAATKVIVNTVNPGLCASEFMRNFTGAFAAAGVVMNLMARTAECGALNIAWAATADTPPAAYVSVSEVKTPGKLVTSDEGKAISARVWKELVGVWRRASPEAAKILSS